MVTSITDFHFQSPHLDPTYAMLVPELIYSDGGGEQSLIFPPEHHLHLRGRSGQKDTHVLLGHTAV
jgi:hypothetical protein